MYEACSKNSCGTCTLISRATRTSMTSSHFDNTSSNERNARHAHLGALVVLHTLTAVVFARLVSLCTPLQASTHPSYAGTLGQAGDLYKAYTTAVNRDVVLKTIKVHRARMMQEDSLD